MDFAANKKYFQEASIKLQLILIAIGVICFFFQPILAILLIAAGAVWIYFAKKKISDEEYDKGVNSEVQKIMARALSKLGLEESEAKEIEPIELGGYVFSGAVSVKQGKDNVWRSSKYEVLMMFFTANEAHCFKCTFSTTEDQHTDMTDVFFYPDIVSVSTVASDTTTSTGVNITGERFVLRTSGGNTIEAGIRDPEYASRSINSIRQLLRTKKSQ